MKDNSIHYRNNISTEMNGEKYSGYYTESKGTITVYYNFHSKSTKSSFNNDAISKFILKELVKEFGKN